MRVVASTILRLIMFPHKGKIMTVDQLTYHDLQGLTALANVIPTINTIDPQGMTTHANVIPAVNTMVDNIPASPLLNVGPRLFVNTTMTAHFPLVSPPLTQNETADLCMVSSSTADPNNNHSCSPNNNHNITHNGKISCSCNHNCIPTCNQ